MKKVSKRIRDIRGQHEDFVSSPVTNKLEYLIVRQKLRKNIVRDVLCSYVHKFERGR